MAERKGWQLNVEGDASGPDRDKIHVIRLDPPQIHLEIDAPSLRSAGAEQKQLARQAIQDALDDLQAALDSLSELPGFPQPKEKD